MSEEQPGLRARRPKRAPTKRAPWGSISREQIVEAAMQTVREGRSEDMTIRSLAADLRVAPMSLYRHVRDKNDLLDEIVSRLLAEVWRPSISPRRWQPWITEAAERLRQLLVDQPAALHVYLQRPVVSPPAIERMEAMLSVLRTVTGDDETARRAYAAIHTYTVGFAALEAARETQSGDTGPADDALTGQLAAYTSPEQFRSGLGYLVEGILGEGAGREPARGGPTGDERPGSAKSRS